MFGASSELARVMEFGFYCFTFLGPKHASTSMYAVMHMHDRVIYIFTNNSGKP